jgi:hypothetical protein
MHPRRRRGWCAGSVVVVAMGATQRAAKGLRVPTRAHAHTRAHHPPPSTPRGLPRRTCAGVVESVRHREGPPLRPRLQQAVGEGSERDGALAPLSLCLLPLAPVFANASDSDHRCTSDPHWWCELRVSCVRRVFAGFFCFCHGRSSKKKAKRQATLRISQTETRGIITQGTC